MTTQNEKSPAPEQASEATAQRPSTENPTAESIVGVRADGRNQTSSKVSRADAMTDPRIEAAAIAMHKLRRNLAKGVGDLSFDMTFDALPDEIKEVDRALAQAAILAASPFEQHATTLTAKAALAAIETFEIVGESNDSREPNSDDRFILTEFIAHAFGGFPVAQPSTADRRAWEYSFIHSSATDRGDTKIGPCLTYDRSIAFGVGCIEQREVFVSATGIAQPEPAVVGERAAFAEVRFELETIRDGALHWRGNPGGWSGTTTACNRALEALARASSPNAAEGAAVGAWLTEDGRTISAEQKSGMLRDGGAGASSVRPYSIPCYLGTPPAQAAEHDSHLRAIMERDAWRAAMQKLCTTWCTTPDDAADHLRQRLKGRAPAQAAEPVDYDRIVSICDAHGIGLPVDCIEMVVEIVRHAAPPTPAPASAISEIDPPQAGGNKGKLPALARTREGHNLYTLGYNRGLKTGREQIVQTSAPAGQLVDSRSEAQTEPAVADERAAFEVAGATAALREYLDAEETWRIVTDAEDPDDIDPIERTMAASRRVAAREAARKVLAVRAAQPAPASAPVGLTDDEITAVWNSMPGGFDGFLKSWGYIQFARALLEGANHAG
ncbi:hypothetical protein [Burkholderia anthina]|uniref:hypothetical protein n=1 Tax=Burkholderia anthina TaxID=179879 RepID=UPI001589E2F2|nr:hypothetical protein [Burkholderia anthina]